MMKVAVLAFVKDGCVFLLADVAFDCLEVSDFKELDFGIG